MMAHDDRPGEARPVGARQEMARKIKPQFSQGPLVKVAYASNQAEAELIQGLLLEVGVPSMARRSAGFDVPDFLAAGPRDVLVPQSGVTTAREVLLEADVVGPTEAAGFAPSPGPAWQVPSGRLLFALLAAFAVGALVIWLLLARG